MMRLTCLTLCAVLGPAATFAEVEQGPANAGFSPAFAEQTRAPALAASAVQAVPFALGLENPWGIAPLGDGRWIVTERSGRMRIIAAVGTLSEPIAGLPGVAADGQGGLLDVATGPDVATDRVVWWTYAKPVPGGSVTAAARGVLSADGTMMTAVTDIFVQDPPSQSPRHFGARIVPDGAGHLFITTGERSSAAERILAQDLATTYGKVIRLNLDGSVPADNPLVGRDGSDAIWSWGHRNMQGAAIDPATGELWTVEHGPAGGDELNRPGAGLNYGWPVVSYGVNYDGTPVGSGAPRGPGFEEPVYYWDPVIAPGGMLFYQSTFFPGWQGDLLIGSLNPGALVRLKLEAGRVVGEERLLTDRGRIRDVEEMPDGSLLVLVDDAEGGIWRVLPE
jgi:glucose/arabinose dehydrogenase